MDNDGTIEWTEERIDRLRHLYDQGVSATAIAADLRGLTRAAVISKIHRLAFPPRPHPNSTWTAERIELLRKLYDQGLSASQIAAQLGDVTRNAVIGKTMRLKLRRRGYNPNSIPAAQPTKKRRVRFVAANTNSTAIRTFVTHEPTTLDRLRCVEVVPLGKTLIELEPDDCRYPYGDQVITFCGHPSDGIYCPAHDALVHRRSLAITEADHDGRRRHFISLNKQSAKAMGLPAEDHDHVAI